MSNKSALIQQIREHAPPELLAWPVWLLWKGKKVPLYANGENRHGTMDTPEDRAQLVDFATAAAALSKHNDAAGLGVALGVIPGTEIVLSGIDFDAAYRDGALDRSAAEVLEVAKESYSERSISGAGFHILGLGNIGPTLKYKDPTGARPGLEIYSSKRYFVMTGQRLNGSRVLTDIGAAARLARRLLGPEPRTQTSSSAEPLPSAHEEAAGILAALKKNGLYRRSDPGGKHHVRCPWEACHSADERGNRSTSQTEATYFEPGAVVTIGGKEQALQHGMFRCQHNACERRRLRDLKDFLGLNTEAAAARKLEFRRIPAETILDPLPAERYLLPGMVPEEAYTLIAGALSAYKSLLLTYLMVWRATGVDLLRIGPRDSAPIEPGPAVLVFYEDTDQRIETRVRRVLQYGHHCLRIEGAAAQQRFLDRAAENLIRVPLAGKFGCSIVRRVQGEIVPNHEMVDALLDGVRDCARGREPMIGLDPLRLAIVGSQNDDDGAEVVVQCLNHIAAAIPGGGLVIASHTTKKQPSEAKTENYAAAAYATAGSALYSQHARSNFYLTRLTPEEVVQNFGLAAADAASQPIAQLTHGRLSHGPERRVTYVRMREGVLTPVAAEAPRSISDQIARALPLVIAAHDRMRTEEALERISETTFCADDAVCAAIGRKNVRPILKLLEQGGFLQFTGKTKDRDCQVTAKGRAKREELGAQPTGAEDGAGDLGLRLEEEEI